MMYIAHAQSRVREFSWSFALRYNGFGFGFHNIWTFFLMVLLFPFTLLFIIYTALNDRGIGGVLLGFIGLFLLGITLYLLLILGKPNPEKWAEIFEHYTNRISVLVRDSHGNVIGEMDNPKLIDKTQSALYPNDLPKFYIDTLFYREERLLQFNNNDTGIMGLLHNPRSFNGVDAIGMPIAIAKSSLLSLVNNNTKPRGGSSLSQQLVKNYYGMYSFDNIFVRKYRELTEAKIFYHNLKENNGEEFKRFVSISTPAMIAQGTQYGIRTASMMIFGKKLHKLEKYEQALLSRMHLNNYKFDNQKRCNIIKDGTLVDLDIYFSSQENKSELQSIKNSVEQWVCPKEPKIPFDFYSDFSQLNSKEKIAYGALDTRIQILASSSASLLKHELSEYRAEYPNQLLIESKMTINSAKNIEFKNSITSALSKIEKRLTAKLEVDLDGIDSTPEEKKANIWISVVNDKGEIVRVYKKGNTAYKRRIGSISKVFASIALGHRGDTVGTYYWNRPYKGLRNSGGNKGGLLNRHNIYKPRSMFGASKNLPVHSALNEYVISKNGTMKLIKKPISNRFLKKIYRSFNLSRDYKTDIKYELSFGVTNATPLILQKAIHKLSHILYYGGQYSEAHIIKSLVYKEIKDRKILSPLKKNIYVANSKISQETANIFTTETKTYMRSVLNGALNKNFGTLRSLNSIKGFNQLFMKSGTTDVTKKKKTLTQSKWTAGAMTVKGKKYSFVIMVENEQGLGSNIKHYEIIKPLFREIVRSLNHTGSSR